MKHILKQVEKKLHYRFRRRLLLQCALTHPSYRHESAPDEPDNQRLEFLGDAVLGWLAAEYLYRTHPDMPEGEMTRLRSAATRTETLAAIAHEIELGPKLLLGKGEIQSGGDQRESNLADAAESVIGAVYLDGGTRAVRKIFNRLFIPHLQADACAPPDENPKGTLQELTQQRWKTSPTYQVLAAEGPEHNRHYTVEVQLENDLSARGTGRTIKAAEKIAARKALHQLSESSC